MCTFPELCIVRAQQIQQRQAPTNILTLGSEESFLRAEKC
uniref:Uncharacterized protein n=1 Tax=Anguilla anguilla TaxID=7936 RepID=A0A0E9QUT0_ANGAN